MPTRPMSSRAVVTVAAFAVGVVCTLGLSGCVVPDGIESAKQGLRLSVEEFTQRLPETVRLNAHETTAFREISEGELALFHPEQTSSWPNDGGSLPQIYEFEGAESGTTGLTMKMIFAGSGQSGGGWTFESEALFLCAAINLEAGTVTIEDIDCPENAAASFPADREVDLADVGITG
ncbi:MAG: hypothetical protein ABWY57_01475 [Mycetocola sp.]